MDLREALLRCLPELAWPEALDARLRALLPTRPLAAGQTLFAQGQPTQAFYLVGEGELEARLGAADGTLSTLGHLRAPTLFGLAAFVARRPSSYEALATRASRVFVIAEPAYVLMMDQWPGFAHALMREFARHFDGNLRLLQAARHQGAAERFELALAQLARERGGPPDAQGTVELRATQAELARLAHLSRQTVNALLLQARREGRLTLGYGRIRVAAAR